MRDKIHKTARKTQLLYKRVFKPYSKKLLGFTKKLTVITVKKTHHYTKITTRFLHHHLAKRPHNHLYNKWNWYRNWHDWKFHKHIHYSVLGVYLAVVGTLVALSYGKVLAASDLFNSWDFSAPASFTLDAGVEVSGTSARLKAQNYTSDVNTAALYHFDEASGAIATDGSSNTNNASVTNGTFITGNLNNGLSLNGSTAYASIPDSAATSLSRDNSIEAWTKFSAPFSAGSHDHKQSVIDKGSYKLYYDQETGKITYELANSTATTWTQQAGNDTKNSWDLNGKLSVNAEQFIGGNLYVGLGNAVGDAEVWKWDGSTWTQIGGDGKNNSWADLTFENVTTLNYSGTILYAGLGSTAGDGEVWSCDTGTGCTSWTKIGGDGINNSWAVNTIEEVDSMTVLGSTLYVGLGTTANDSKVYAWNGSTWTWVGGFGITGAYNAFPTGYEAVYSMSNDGSSIYVGFGSTAGDADVWRLTGTTWTQIGGDAVNSSWAASTYESVISMRYFGGNLYAGLGTTAGDGEVWMWNGSSWAKIGGDNLNSGWDAVSYEGVYSFTDDGTNLYAGLGLSAGDNEVWMWNGSSWAKIGGDGVNGGFTNTHIEVNALSYGNSTLYAGLIATGNNAEVWSFTSGSWTRIGGGYINKSWGGYNIQNVESMTVYGSYLYAGTGNTVAGNALVWRFDGNSWQIVGGQGINNSWAATTYEDVTSMISFGGNLYVGLGTSANDAEVWKYDGSTWNQIGGDSLNSGWTTNFEEVSSMAVLAGNLYAGIGNSANDAEVWMWNGSSWAKIGGDSLNSGWTTNFERVSSLSVYDGQLYAGLGLTAGDAEVWRWNGSSWAKIGGDGVNSSWNTVYEQVESMIPYNGKLYAGLGNSTGDAELWEWTGTAWSIVGGDGVNGSWLDGQYEQVKSLVTYNGKLYAGLGNSAGDGEVWEMDGSSWSKIGGGGTNSSWTANATESVRSFSVYKGKLYAGLGDSANTDAAVWSYGNNGFLQSTVGSQDTSWHHIAATYDGTTMKLYVDGVVDAQTSVSLTMPDTTQPALIGTNFGPSETGWSRAFFEGMLDELRISNIARGSFNTLPYSANHQAITLAAAVRTSGVAHWDNFTSDETANGGAITYRLSDDNGTTWKYWNSGWVTSSGLAQSNTAAVIGTNIATFPATLYGIRWQAVLKGNGTQQVTLNTIDLAATSDLSAPNTNASALHGYKTNGGTELNTNDWTNGSSPYFSWTAGTDTGSGIKGYCLYLGTNSSADPTTTKGLLGTSPLDTAGHCQFAVSGNSVDLSTAGYMGSPLTTSNSSYYLLVRAIDNAGNIFGTSAEFHFRFDNTPPTNPGFITAPSGFINTKSTTLTWPTSGGQATSDTASGVAGLQYRINASSWYGDNHTGSGDMTDLLADDGSYVTVDPTDFNNIIEGVNTVYFRTWDNAGNVTSGYVTAALKVNTAGSPSEPQNVHATPASNTTNAFAFSWNAPNSFVGDVNHLTYCYTINTLPSPTTCAYTSAGVTSLGSGPYATQPGTNTFYVVAKDESDNINYSSFATVDFTANTPSPGIPTNTDIVDVSIKSTSNWRLAITWDSPVDTGAGIASYKVLRSTNNVAFSFVGSSTSTTYIDAGLNQQLYYYKVRACDSTNNCGSESTVVQMLPTGKFTSPATLTSDPSASNLTTKKATITWATDRASDSKIALGTTSGQYGSSEIGNSTQINLHTIQLDNLSAGTTYYYVAKWTDEDGNTGTSQEFTFTTAPAPVVKEVETVSVSLSSAVIQFVSNGASKVTLYYGKSESFGGLQSINTSSAESKYSFALSGLDDGTKYFFRISAFDSEGSEYFGNVFSFTTPQRPRIINLRFQPVTGEPTSTQSVTWQTNVPSNTTVTYGKVNSSGIDVQKSGLVTDHEITISNLEDDSEYFLLAQSRDAAGNLAVSDRQVFKTALDTRPPKVSDITVESSIRGSGAEARGQIIVSWKTDEPSSSQVAYGEGSNVSIFNSKTSEDGELTTEHIVIISDLPTSKVYSVQPVSRDRGGNAGLGEPQSTIIGRASDSILTVIINSLQKIFGF